MKKKILLFVFLISISSMTVYALTKFNFDTSDLSFTSNGKRASVVGSFNQDYNLSYSVTDQNKELEEEIKNLTKKTTYLLFGDMGDEEESIEDYYKRKQDWYDLRYEPKSTEDPQDYRDDIISGLAIPQLFSQAYELGLLYYSYGDIRVTVNEKDNIVISTIVLPDVKIKEQSKEDPMKYDFIETNYVMHYYYKKLDDEWKLYYLYGEDEEDISEYINEVETTESKAMAVIPSYSSELKEIVLNLKSSFGTNKMCQLIAKICLFIKKFP